MDFLDLRRYRTSELLICSVLFLGVVLCTLKAYRIGRQPLAHLPGPTISKWTNLRLKYAVFKGERVHYVHSLHEGYGPIVRISPWEVSLADISAAKTIYKVGGTYTKAEWYDNFTGNMPNRNLFTHTNPRAHATLRKLAAFNFTEKSIRNLEPFLSKNVKKAIARMADDFSTKGYCDAFKWFTFMATDVIGEASFGESFRMLETGQKNQYIRDLEKIGQMGIIRTEFPLVAKVGAMVPLGPAAEISRSITRLIRYGDESVQRYWRNLKTEPDTIKPTLLTKEYDAVDSGVLTIDQLNRDATGYIVAGTDTTAIAATNAVWFLAQDQAIEQALIREVMTLPESFVDDDLRFLTLLNNVISETLRLATPIAQGLPRHVPEGGAELCGHYIPRGTVVGVQAWTMHRNPEIWMHPNHFDPSRWNEPTKDMQHSYLPFGGGSRVCIGSHFAQMELRHALANFYRTFHSGVRPSAAEGFTEDDMTPKSYVLQPPKGKRCLLEPRN